MTNYLKCLGAMLLALASAVPASGLAQDRITGGYVLTHEHPMNAMAFGGNYAFTGAPGNFRNGIMLKGYTAKGSGCQVGKRCDHGEIKGNLAGLLVGSDMGNHKAHFGPNVDAFSHARYSTEWIEEAFRPSEREYQDTRMKIMVAFAVESYSMCETLYYANKGGGGPGGKGYPCERGESIKSLERQIRAIKAWVKENSSWMAIAYTAADARRIIKSDKLAIILGVESEYSFGAEDKKFDPVARLNRYYKQGVRTFYLAHKMNSRLAGADIFLRAGSFGGKAIRTNQALAGCFFYDDNVGDFPLKNNQGHEFCDNKCGPNHFKGGKLLGLLDKCAFKPSDISEANTIDYVLARGNTTFNGFKIYPNTPGFPDPGGSKIIRKYGVDIERNNLGLSHDGERVVRAAMLKGMIVNIDHVSSESRRDMRRVARAFKDYPLNALHNNPNALLTEPHEYDFDDEELTMITETGGFFGVRVGPLDAKPWKSSGITRDCPKTMLETAQTLAYLLDKGLSIGYSLDYATITRGVFSRTEAECDIGARGRPDDFHMYGTHEAGGLSHIGMMKKFHRELQTIGFNPTHLGKLRNDGVEQFVRMWERSERNSKFGKQIERQIFDTNLVNDRTCEEDSNCRTGEFCAAGVPGLRQKRCQAKKGLRAVCTSARQCQTGRCSAGFCAKQHECRLNSDCSTGQYCANPVGSARSCKPLKPQGQGCTSASQCASGRCSGLRCVAQHECRLNSDCSTGQYCASVVGSPRSCKPLKPQGQGCTNASQCASGRCSALRCAAADECSRNADCAGNQFCGDPVAGRRKCKARLSQGKLCTKGLQCRSGCCKPHISTGGLPSCRPASKC